MQEALENFNIQFNWGEAESVESAAPERSAPAGVKQKRGWGFIGDIANSVKDTATDTVDSAKDTVNDIKDTAADIVDDAGDIIDTTLDVIGGAIEDHDKEWELRFDLKPDGEAPQRMGESILPSGKELYCVECYFKGKFKFAGHVKVEKLVVLKEASFSVAPVDVSLMLKLNAKFEASEWTQSSIPVMSFPLGAIAIPGVFHFGPEVAFDFDLGYEINEPLDFEFGVSGSLPNDAIIQNNIMKDNEVNFANWDKSEVNALPFDLKSGVVDVRVEAGPTLSLSFGFEFMSLVGYEARLRAALPHYTATFTSIMDEEGACDDAGEKLGVQIVESLKTNLRFHVGPSGLLQGSSQALVDKELWKWEKDLGTSCKSIKSYADEAGPEDAMLDELTKEEEALDEQLSDLEEDIYFGEMMLGTLPGMPDGMWAFDETAEGEEGEVEEFPDDAVDDESPVESPVESEIPSGILFGEMPTEVPVDAPVEALFEAPVEVPDDAPAGGDELPAEMPVKSPIELVAEVPV